jgi:hypothetical protein
MFHSYFLISRFKNTKYKQVSYQLWYSKTHSTPMLSRWLQHIVCPLDWSDPVHRTHTSWSYSYDFSLTGFLSNWVVSAMTAPEWPWLVFEWYVGLFYIGPWYLKYVTLAWDKPDTLLLEGSHICPDYYIPSSLMQILRTHVVLLVSRTTHLSVSPQ